MIKFEYIPWTAERTWGYAEDVPPVESVTMTLGDDVTWQEATDEFHNFLRGAGYVIPYYNVNEADEDDYIDCSDPPDMDKSGSLGDRQPEWANSMSEDDSNTDVAEKREWVGLTGLELIDLCEKSYRTGTRGETFFSRGYFADAIEAKLKEKNT